MKSIKSFFTRPHKQEILDALTNAGFRIGRLICFSKSEYCKANPDHCVLFNANIIINKYGKIWHGDLDLTIDGDILKGIANQFKTTLYVLYEMDARFNKEKKDPSKLIKKARWNSDIGFVE